ncbi:hypothetical protein DXA95_12385 [Odoribacter sp. OF09-27XD]|nr:hypothetical protein [Odoribacter sp. OF09-27XD]RHV92596.1 hypothetical protein DXA95_12385 [Odoribacter sp. OF09-27XD]
MAEFKDSVYDITERRVLRSKTLAENQNKSNIEDAIILGFVFGKLGKYTFRERLNMYSNQIKMEIEAAIAGGLFKDMSGDQIVNQIMMYLNNPYLNPSIQEAIRKGSFAATRIKSQGITYGTGRYISGFADLKRMGIMAISQGYNYANHRIWGNNKNIIGYYVFRNSSYPCAICDDGIGFHKITENVLPWHPNCVCGAFPVYKDDIIEGMTNNDILKIRRKQLFAEAKESLSGKTFTPENIGREIRFTTTGIKEFLNQPHEQYAAKNELITNIRDVIRKAEYKGYSDYHKNNPNIKASHIFETKVGGIDSWIIVRENIDGPLFFYSISDNRKVLKNIKNNR